MIRGGYWGGAWGLSWGGSWGEAWRLLNQPYQELSLKGQVFVRSYLASVYSADVAERIVAVAKVNGLSVRDAEVAVAAKAGVVNGFARQVSDQAVVGHRQAAVSSASHTHQVSQVTRSDVLCALGARSVISVTEVKKQHIAFGQERQ